jgi:hypothetical protein
MPEAGSGNYALAFSRFEATLQSKETFANPIGCLQEFFAFKLAERVPPSVVKRELLADEHRNRDAHVLGLDVVANGGHGSGRFDDGAELRAAQQIVFGLRNSLRGCARLWTPSESNGELRPISLPRECALALDMVEPATPPALDPTNLMAAKWRAYRDQLLRDPCATFETIGDNDVKQTNS